MNIVWEQRKRNIEHSIRRARRFFPYKRAAVLLVVLILIGASAFVTVNKPTLLSSIVGHPVSVSWEGDPVAPLDDMLEWEITRSFPGSLPSREVDVAVLSYKNGSATKATFYKESHFVDVDGQIYTYNPDFADNVLHKLAKIIPF